MDTLLIIILSFLFGTLLGSFFYTLAHRYATGQIGVSPVKALFSRSRCPGCGEQINLPFLVPVLGYIILKGKCRHCGIRISALYPAAELLYGAMASLFAWKLGLSLLTLNLYLLAGLALCISLIDLKAYIIPNSLVAVFVVLSIYPVIINYNIKDNILGLIALFLLFMVILLLFPGSFGGGDVKLGGAIGFLFGFEMSIVVLETALLSGAIIGISYALIKRKSLKTKIPFAPFLTLGLVVAMLYGRDILLIYYRLLF